MTKIFWFRRKSSKWRVLSAVAGGCALQLAIRGQIIPETGSIQNDGHLFTITPANGVVKGANVFHSFTQFNLSAGQEAKFTITPGIQNILARVTDGPSTIDGKLSAEANLYLLNRNGITFGPNANLDIAGSFYASTADYIALSDGTRFNGTGTIDGNTLTAAAPAAFGFLGNGNGKITVQKASLIHNGDISLIGGDISIQGNGNLDDSPATIKAPGKTITLASMVSEGELPVATETMDSAHFSARGSINISSAVLSSTPLAPTTEDPTRRPGGHIVIRAGKLQLLDSSIQKDTYAAGSGLAIDIKTSGNIELNGTSTIKSEGLHPSDKAEGISLSAQNLLFENESRVLANNFGSGTGADLNLSATESLEANGEIQASTSLGNGGHLGVEANNAVINTQNIFVENRGPHEPPSLTFKISDRLEMLPDSAIRGGASGTGPGASLRFEVGNLQMQGNITVESFGSGAAGSIYIARDSVGTPARSVSISSSDAATFFNAGLAASSTYSIGPFNSTGEPGHITVVASDLKLAGATTFIESANNLSSAAGAVALFVDNLSIQAGADLLLATHGTGPGGSLFILGTTAAPEWATGAIPKWQQTPAFKDVALANPARRVSVSADQFETLASRTFSSHIDPIFLGTGILAGSFGGGANTGEGGTATVSAKSIELSGAAARISSIADTSKAGDITLNAVDQLVIRDGGKVLVSSKNSQAGSIQLTSQHDLQLINGTISAEGKLGGEVGIGAGNLVYLSDSTVTAATISGQGGNIAIPRLTLADGRIVDCLPSLTPAFVVLNRSTLAANADSGAGGNIGIEADHFIKSTDSSINVSSTFGASGKQDVPTESFDLSASLVELKADKVGAPPAFEQPAGFAYTEPGGYVLVGRERLGDRTLRRRIILESK